MIFFWSSKFLPPGSVRIDLQQTGRSEIGDIIAFATPENNMTVVVAANRYGEPGHSEPFLQNP